MKTLSGNLKKSAIGFILFVFIFIPLLSSKAVKLGGLDKTANGIYGDMTSTKKDPLMIIGSIIEIILSLVGVVFLCLLIYAGYLWMLARGNDQEVEKAQKIIKNAIIGLVIVITSYVITLFVSQLAGTDSTITQETVVGE